MTAKLIKKKEIPLHDLTPEMVDLESIVSHPRNVRVHPRENIETIKRSLKEFGQTIPILLDTDGQVIKGNGTLQSVRELGWPQIAVIRTSLSGKVAEAYALVDNKSTDESHFDEALLAEVLKDLQGENIDLAITGFKPYELAPLLSNEEDPVGIKLADLFLVPPFSILDARQGYWQKRKKAWISLGIHSELGRGASNEGNVYALDGRNPATMGESMRKVLTATRKPTRALNDHAWQERVLGKVQAPTQRTGNLTYSKRASTAESTKKILLVRPHATPGGGGGGGYLHRTEEGYASAYNTEGSLSEASGTSIFDPVLCELFYRWFTKKGDLILDPFSGGSVRGIVAGKLERAYVGIDLSARQVQANRVQANNILHGKEPDWIVGDSLNVKTLVKRYPTGFNSIFTCPPYGDLEVYSDDARDISNMKFGKFVQTFKEIIKRSVALLREDRFAGIVVGDYRDTKTGVYRNFPTLTIEAFEEAGMSLYNEAILVTMVGSLPLRTKNQFQASRKLGKTHQNVYIFIKGDARRATERLGHVEVGEVLPQPEVAEREEG